MLTESNDNIKNRIVACFKELMEIHPFNKITVTMLADKAGILRPVFYRYFKDKYEIMDYMLYNDVTKELRMLLEHDMAVEALKLLFTHIMQEEKLYKRLFETTGQNCFEKIMVEQFVEVFTSSLKVFNTDVIPENPLLTPRVISKYLVLSLTTSIKEYLNSPHPYTVEQAVEAYFFLVSHSIFDLINKDFRPKSLDSSTLKEIAPQ